MRLFTLLYDLFDGLTIFIIWEEWVQITKVNFFEKPVWLYLTTSANTFFNLLIFFT